MVDDIVLAIMVGRYFRGAPGHDILSWIRLVEAEMKCLRMEDDEERACYAHQGLEGEAYDMYGILVEDAQHSWNTLKLVFLFEYWEILELVEYDKIAMEFHDMYESLRQEMLWCMADEAMG